MQYPNAAGKYGIKLNVEECAMYRPSACCPRTLQGSSSVFPSSGPSRFSCRADSALLLKMVEKDSQAQGLNNCYWFQADSSPGG